MIHGHDRPRGHPQSRRRSTENAHVLARRRRIRRRRAIESGYDRWVGAVVIDDDGRVLFVENGWIVPGGNCEIRRVSDSAGDDRRERVEPAESLEEAAVREVAEETGVEVEVDRPLAVVRQTFSHGENSIRAGSSCSEVERWNRRSATSSASTARRSATRGGSPSYRRRYTATISNRFATSRFARPRREVARRAPSSPNRGGTPDSRPDTPVSARGSASPTRPARRR